MSRGLDNFHSQYLYRVLRPNESPNKDLVCCDPSSPRTIDEHVETGLTQPSRFISTTSDSNAAHRWLDKANEMCIFRHFNIRTVIVKIDVQLLKSRYSQIAAAAYDLSNSLNRNAFLKTEKQNKFSESYHEVVFMDRIPSDVFSIFSILGNEFITNNKINNTESSILSSTLMGHPLLSQSIYSANSNSELDGDSNSQISSASGFSTVPVNGQRIDRCRTDKSTPAFGAISNPNNKPNRIQSASSMYNIDLPNNNLDYPTNSQTSSSRDFSTLPVNRPQDGAPLTYNPSLGRTLGAESSPNRSNYVQSASHINLLSTKANPEIDSKKAANLRKLPGIDTSSSPLKTPQTDTSINHGLIRDLTLESDCLPSVPSISEMNQRTNDDDLVDANKSPFTMATDTSLLPVNNTSIDTSTTDKWASTMNPVNPATSTSHLKRNLFKQDTHSPKFLRDQSTLAILTEKASSVHEPRSKEFYSSILLSNYNQSSKSIEKIKSKAKSPTNTPMSACTHSSAASEVKLDGKTENMPSTSGISCAKSLFPVKGQHFDTLISDKSIKSLTPEFNPVRSNYSRSVSSMSKVNNTPPTDHGPVDVTNSSQQTSTINPIKPATSTSHLRKTLFKQERHSPKFLRDSFSSHTNSRPILYPPSPTSLTTELNERTLIPAILTEKASSVHEPRSKESHSSIFLSNYNQSSKSIEKIKSKAKSPTNTPMSACTHSSAASEVKLDDKTDMSSSSDISFLPNKKTHLIKSVSSDFQPVSPVNEIKTSSSIKIDPERTTVCRVLPDSAKSNFPVKRRHFDTLISDKSIKSLTPESSPVRSNYSRSVSSMSKVNNTPPTDHGPVDVTNSSQQTSTINPIKPATSTSHLRKTLLTQDRHSPKFLRDSFSSHTNSRPILYPPSPTSLTTELNERTLIPAILTEKASSVHEPRSKEFHSSIFLSNYNQSSKSIEKIKSKAKSPTNTPMSACTHSSAASKVKLDDKTDDTVGPIRQRETSPSI